jgi:hypothetical protein
MKNALQSLRTLLLLTFILCACKKPEQETTVSPDPKIRIDAFVPVAAWTSYNRVYLDASRTLSLNGGRALRFAWSILDFPSGISRPRIIDSNVSIAAIDSLITPGTYRIGLAVQDQKGNRSDTTFTLEVMRDNLLDHPTRANAGEDIVITAPVSYVDLNGMETYRLNPAGRNLDLYWQVTDKPVGSPQVFINSPQSPVTRASNLRQGRYLFALEVVNELGIRASDTVTVTVLPDSMTGKTLVFENLTWEKYMEPDNGWGEWIYVALRVKDSRFLGREPKDIELSVWNEASRVWEAPGTYEFFVDADGTLVVYYPWDENESIYFKDLGKKTKVQVKFL